MRIYSQVCITILVFLLSYAALQSINSTPQEADSLSIHIPIAKSVLDGSFLSATKQSGVLYPASNEYILSLLIFLNIPLNIFNVLSVVFLFFTSFFLGVRLKFSKDFSVVFATTFCTLYGVQRWLLTQKIDVWLLGFFLLSLALLQKIKSERSYFFVLGVSLGMLAGGKFTGIFFAILLILFHAKKLVKNLTYQRLIFFIFPFTILGLFWYIRNYIGTGNPFYPLPFLIFEGNSQVASFTNWTVMKSLINNPMDLLNAFISEYMIWSATLIAVPIFYIHIMRNKLKLKNKRTITVFFLLGVLNLIIYTRLPSLGDLDSVIFGVRYSFPAVSMFIVSAFYLAHHFKREELISKISIANMVGLFGSVYQPKLIFITVPITILLLDNTVQKFVVKKLRRFWR